jgi:polyhydroxyalkanoate synthesis regulator phasin
MIRLSRSLRVGLAASVAVLVLGGAAVGIAAAQAQPTPSAQAGQNRYQAFVDALAKRLGVSSANLETAISGARTDAGMPAGGQGFPGAGRGGNGGPRGRAGFGADLNTAATAIGIPVAQLRTELAGKSLAQVATAHGKTANDVATALKNAANTRIDQAVTAGKLTADKANTLKTQIGTRIDQLVNQVRPAPGTAGQGRPGGPGRPGGQGGPAGGAGFRGAFGAGLDAAATAIGIPVDQLRTELAGKSLAQVATAHGKTANDVATALKNAAHTRVDQAVTAGRLTADQATSMKTKIDAGIDKFVNQVVPQRGARPARSSAASTV